MAATTGAGTTPAADTTAFLAYLAQGRPLVEEWIASHAWEAPAVASNVADKDRYLYAPLAHFNAGGGKRVRPVLALLGCEAAGGEPTRALATGCAVELFQSAALIHDDIADEGTMRRGEPCLHVSHGVGLAINAGDAALVQASEAILSDEGLDAHTRVAVMGEFTAMERRTLEGQALDLGWVRDGRWDLREDDYLAMATLKTAHYSCATPLVMGALCGGGSAEQVEALRQFGLDAGLAFQIQDDLLNLCGDAGELGKDFLTDITEGKRTLPVLHALAHLGESRRERLLALVSSGTTEEGELREAVALLDEAGALEHARSVAESLAERAVRHLDSVKLDAQAHAVLVSMAHFFVERAS